MPDLAAVASLVRLPAVLSAPGDSLLGAAASGARRTPVATAGLAASSACLYLAGMALNDYADREVDAVERPHRPIPAGDISPAFALGTACTLTAGGLALAGLAGGRRAGSTAAALAATVWAYDLVFKGGPAGPVAMAAARALNVVLGADPQRRAAAIPAAAVIGAHTLKITVISRSEVSGADSKVGAAALAGTSAVAAAATALGLRGRSRHAREPIIRGTLAGGLITAYAASSARAEVAALRDPSPAALQRAVGTGVLNLLPLQAGLHAAAGGPVALTGALAAVWPWARTLGRRRAVT